MKKCPKCGVEVFETMSICPKCFSFISNEERHENVENKNNDILNDNNILKEEDNEKIYDVSYENYFTKYLTDIIVKHYCDFKGREGKKVFWLFTLNCFIISFILNLILGFISGTLSIIVYLALLLPSLGIFVRRLHDANFSGWWALTLLIPIPFLWIIILIIVGCLPGTKGENKYGTINS